MTVLQILPALDGGGVERGTLEVAQALVEAGHRSLVISSGGRLVDELEKQGSEHFNWPVWKKSLWTLRWIWPLRRFIQEHGVDLVHYRSRVPGWIAYLAWKGMRPQNRPRLVSTVHGLHSVNVYSAVMTKGERVIAVSDMVERYIAESYPATARDCVQVIYRGVDPAFFDRNFTPDAEWLDQWRRQYPQLSGRFVITLPGRLTRLKGHHDFLTIIEQLKGRGLPVIGLVIGGEDLTRETYAQSLYQAVAERGLQDDVLFTGQRSDIREIYSQSRLVLSLSTKPESFGRTVLEALTMGCPVLGYAHGGVGEILSHLYPAGCVGVGRVDEMVDKIARAIDEGLPAVPVNDLYLKKNMLSETLSLYRSLVTNAEVEVSV